MNILYIYVEKIYVNRNERGVKMGCIINIENIVINGLKDNLNVSVGCVV